MGHRKMNSTRLESLTTKTMETCRHYWMIESARGPVSKGVCKFCGAKREFHNSWPYFPIGKTTEKAPEIPEETGNRQVC